MYSDSAKMKVIFDYDLPREQLAEIARQHYKRAGFAAYPRMTVDYYWLYWKGLVVVIDGPGISKYKYKEREVQNWRWEKMQEFKLQL